MKRTGMAALLTLLATAAWMPPSAAGPPAAPGGTSAQAGRERSGNIIRDIRVEQKPDAIQLIMAGSTTPSFTSFKLQEPLRVFIDIAGADLSQLATPLRVENGVIDQVVAMQLQDDRKSVGRLIIGLEGNAPYRLEARGNELIMTVTARSRTASPASATHQTEIRRLEEEVRARLTAAETQIAQRRAALEQDLQQWEQRRTEARQAAEQQQSRLEQLTGELMAAAEKRRLLDRALQEAQAEEQALQNPAGGDGSAEAKRTMSQEAAQRAAQLAQAQQQAQREVEQRRRAAEEALEIYNQQNAHLAALKSEVAATQSTLSTLQAEQLQLQQLRLTEEERLARLRQSLKEAERQRVALETAARQAEERRTTAEQQAEQARVQRTTAERDGKRLAQAREAEQRLQAELAQAVLQAERQRKAATEALELETQRVQEVTAARAQEERRMAELRAAATQEEARLAQYREASRQAAAAAEEAEHKIEALRQAQQQEAARTRAAGEQRQAEEGRAQAATQLRQQEEQRARAATESRQREEELLRATAEEARRQAELNRAEQARIKQSTQQTRQEETSARAALASAQAKVTSLRSETAAKQEEARQLTAQVASLRAQQTQLTAQLSQTQATQATQQALTRTQQENSQLKSQVAEALAKLTQTRQSLDEIRRQAARAEQAEAEARTAKTELERVKSEVARSRSELEQTRDTAEALRQRTRELQQETALLRQNLSSSQATAEARGQQTETERVQREAQAAQQALTHARQLSEQANLEGQRAQQLGTRGKSTPSEAPAADSVAERARRAALAAASLAGAPPAVATSQALPAPTSPAGDTQATIRDVRFEDGSDRSTIVIEHQGALDFMMREPGDGSVVLHLDRTRLPRSLERTLDTSALATPVRSVSSFVGDPKTGDVRITVALDRSVESNVRREQGRLIWTFLKSGTPTEGGTLVGGGDAPPTGGNRMSPFQPVRYTGGQVAGYTGIGAGYGRRVEAAKERFTGKRVTLDLRDADIHNVMRLLAKEGRINIIASEEVSGKITLHLERIPWDQALDVILKTKGLTQSREGEIIWITPLSTLREQQKMEMEVKKARQELEPLEVRLVTANYADVDDLSKQTAALLSKRGAITLDKRTKTMIIKDVPDHAEAVEDLLRRLDTQTPLVLIEGRIVEANSNYKKEFGIQWGGDASMSPGGGNPTGLQFPGIVGIQGGADDTQTAAAGLPTSPHFVVNLPAAAGGGSGGALALQFGSIGGAANLNIRLTAAEEEGQLKIISSPKVTTLNNAQASIQQGTSIPIAVVSAQGINTVFFDANLELQVTPHVTQDGHVLLDIFISKNEPDFSRTGARGDPTILRKSTKTSMLIKDGDTTVIGGVFTRQKTSNEKKVPFFGDIPILGGLFNFTSEEEKRTEMLIFITPRIVNRSEAVVKTGKAAQSASFK